MNKDRTPMDIERRAGSAAGRSRTSIFASTVWTVANAPPWSGDLQFQIKQTLAQLDANLREANSDRSHLLSVQVLLNDMRDKAIFDEMWLAWIGPDPAAWPQRSCVEVRLSPGLLVEITAVAAVIGNS